MSSLGPNNEHQSSFNHFRPCILDNQGAIRIRWSTIKLAAALLVKNAYDKIITMSQNQCQQSVNGASTMFDRAFGIFQWQWNADKPLWTNQQPLMAKMLVTISHLRPTIEYPQTVNSFCAGSEWYTAMNCVVMFLSRVLRSQSLQSVLVYNFTNMHAMS